MNAVLERIEGEVVDDCATLFTPVSSDLLDGLLGQYQATRKRIETVAEFVGGELDSWAIAYFLDGIDSEHGRHCIGVTAILSAGHANPFPLTGFACEFTRPVENAFPGVSVSVVIPKAVKTV
jgi:hypothetical protein